MFAYWHMLRLCAQPSRWGARVMLCALFLLVLSLSWQVADAIPIASGRSLAAAGQSIFTTLDLLLLL